MLRAARAQKLVVRFRYKNATRLKLQGGHYLITADLWAAFDVGWRTNGRKWYRPIQFSLVMLCYYLPVQIDVVQKSRNVLSY